MAMVLLGIRNVYRNHVRTTLVVLVLGMSVGFFITMLKTSESTALLARSLKSQVATLIEVSPVGQPSGGSGWASLPREKIDDLQTIPHVSNVEKYLRKQFVDNTRKLSAAMGVVIGVDPGTTLRLAAMGGFISSPLIIEGRNLASTDRGKAVAVVGKVFAQERGLTLGSEFTIPAGQLKGRRPPSNKNIKDMRGKVVGIFSTGVVYGDNQVFVPLRVVQENLDMDGEISVAYVTVDSAENVGAAADALIARLGPAVDVVSQNVAAVKAAGSLDAVSSYSRLGAIIAALVGLLVVMFTMMLITRERTREIGILKAIGASDAILAGIFTVETIALDTIGTLLGLFIYFLAAPILAAIFIGSIGAEVAGGSRYGPSLIEIAYALGLIVVFSIFGSIYPVYRAIRMRPADTMRQL